MEINGEGGVLRVVGLAIRGFSRSPPHKTAEAHNAQSRRIAFLFSSTLGTRSPLPLPIQTKEPPERRQPRPRLVFLSDGPSVPGSSAISYSANPIPLGLATVLGVAWLA
jgi:hypothetical protein